jgi:hypothetical protein
MFRKLGASSRVDIARAMEAAEGELAGHAGVTDPQ